LASLHEVLPLPKQPAFPGLKHAMNKTDLGEAEAVDQ
jgi:hypothetical protein